MPSMHLQLTCHPSMRTNEWHLEVSTPCSPQSTLEKKMQEVSQDYVPNEV